MVPSFLFVLLLSLLSPVCHSQIGAKPRCNAAFQCSDEENPVYATSNGGNCLVFRNACHMLKANCDRINRYDDVAEPIPVDLCLPLCQEVCSEMFNPICGIYNDEVKTFGSICEMQNHICRTGLTYSVYNVGMCPEREVKE